MTPKKPLQWRQKPETALALANLHSYKRKIALYNDLTGFGTEMAGTDDWLDHAERALMIVPSYRLRLIVLSAIRKEFG